jgi:hypothetical protein
MTRTDDTMNGKIQRWRRVLFLLFWLTRPVRALWLCFFPMKFHLEKLNEQKRSYRSWFRIIANMDYLHCDPVFRRRLEMMLSRAGQGPSVVEKEAESE